MNKKQAREIRNRRGKTILGIVKAEHQEKNLRKQMSRIKVGYLAQENIDNYAAAGEPLPCVVCENEISSIEVTDKKFIGFRAGSSYFAHLSHYFG